MFDLTIENQYGQRVELTHSPLWTVAEIDGLDPPDAIINTMKNAGMDGSVFNSATADNRQIIITLAINGEAEQNRISLYRYIKTKQKVRIYYRNGLRNVYIDGYVKNFTIAFFDKKEVAQITILCTDPYFQSARDEDFNLRSLQALFEFPFEIETPIPFSEIISVVGADVYNAGDIPTGFIATLNTRGDVVRPKISIGSKYMELDITIERGNSVVIDTIKKQKSITMKYSTIAESNIIKKLTAGSTWLELDPTDNYVTITAQSGAEKLDVTFTVIDLYEGV